jgi:hypothetical protein
MKSLMLLGAFLALAVNMATFAAPGPAGASSALKDAVILVIRHAEKPDKGDSLSPAGEAHAQAYANYFKHFAIDGQPHQPDHLFAAKDSSSSDRPRLTLEPTSKALGLAIDSQFNDNQFQELARELKSSSHGTNLLICWHHGNIPQLLHALDADPETLLPKAKWPDAEFGWLIQLRYDENGQLLESKRITENFAPADSGQLKPEPDTKSVAKPPARVLRSGGIDPHGDSLGSIQNSLQQFGHLEFMLRLFLNLILAVACAWVIAWHPRSTRVDPLSDLEERKAFIILGVVGAIVAELSGTSQTLAFVIFGIGALLRFRTVLDNPKATGKAILVVVIGLACGMGSWTMAVFVTAFCWLLLYWLDSKAYCWIKVRLDGDADPKPVSNAVQSLLVSHHCRIQSQTLSKSKRRVAFLFQMPTGLHPHQLEAELKVKLPKVDESRINVEIV